MLKQPKGTNSKSAASYSLLNGAEENILDAQPWKSNDMVPTSDVLRKLTDALSVLPKEHKSSFNIEQGQGKGIKNCKPP